MSTPLLTVELHDYQWRDEISAEFRRPAHVLVDMAVTPRPVGVQGWLEGAAGRHWGRLGDVFLVPPGIGFTGYAPGGASQPYRHRSLSCLLSLQLFDRIEVDDGVWQESLYPTCFDLAHPCITAGLRRLLDELLQPGFASAALLESLGATLALDLVRTLQGARQRQAPRGGLPAWRQCLLEDRLLAEALPPPDISELARLVGLSTRQLMRAFLAQSGCGLGQHIRTISIERSKRLLASRCHAIKDIAAMLGFSSTASFSHAFRRVTGLRPGEYQQVCSRVSESSHLTDN